ASRYKRKCGMNPMDTIGCTPNHTKTRCIMATAKAKCRRKSEVNLHPWFEDFPVFRQKKFPVYQSPFNLNVAFQTIAFEIERLDDYETVSLDTLPLYRMTAEELRLAMNHRIAGNREQVGAARSVDRRGRT